MITKIIKVSKSENQSTFDYYTHNTCQVKDSVNLLLDNIAYSLQTKSFLGVVMLAKHSQDMHPLLLFLQYGGYFEKDIQGCSHTVGTLAHTVFFFFGGRGGGRYCI